MSLSTDYYDKESGAYSAKRYPLVSTDYVHFFFKKRRDILLSMIGSILPRQGRDMSLLEIGCADGIILGSIHDAFPQIGRLTGVDVSEEMIARARSTRSSDISFYVRRDLPPGRFDAIVEVGVINLADLRTELVFAHGALEENGHFICSVASRTSLRNMFKPTTSFRHHLTFSEYEAEISVYFDIVESRAYGLFVPKLWAVPAFGRALQPLFDALFSRLAPELFHEKIYMLKKRA